MNQMNAPLNRPMNATQQIKEFTRLWTKAQPAVAAFISSMVPDFNQAEDVLQQVSMALLDNFEGYDPERPFVAWAIGVAKLEILSHRRKSAVDRHVFDSEAVAMVADAFADIRDELGGINEALAKCLKSVQGKSREAFELRYTEDMRPAEIADQMGMSTNAVSVLLHRSRNFLRRCIKQRVMVAGVQ